MDDMTARERRLLAEIIGEQEAAKVARAQDVRRRCAERHARRLRRELARLAER